MTKSDRQVFIYGILGEREFLDILGALMVGLIISPDNVWLASPWVSDFDLLDNRSDDWTSVRPEWGQRFISFSEMLATAITSGCRVTIVTKDEDINQRFIDKLTNNLAGNHDSVKWIIADQLHTKGLLTSDYFLAGSMNFTYSGTHRNDERVRLSMDKDEVTEARLEFEARYLQTS